MLQLFRALGNVVALLSLLLALSHCGGSDLLLPTSNPPGAFRIEPLAGDNQSGVVGAMLSLPLAVKVTSDSGGPVEGVTVSWAAANGGSVSASTSTTNAQGLAQVLRTLGSTPGAYATQAEAAGLSGSPVLFRATALAIGELPPVAADDEYDTNEGHSNTLSVGPGDGVLHNDVDPEGEALTASDASDPPNGVVSLNPDGSFSYNPEVNFFGNDSFTYTARDPHGKSSTATVTIHVAPVNDPPLFSDAGNTPPVDEHAGPQTFESWATEINPGAENEADQVLEFQVVSNSNPGLFTSDGQPAVTRNDPQSSAGRLTFTPSGAEGIATITVVLKDNGGMASGGVDTSSPHSFAILIY
ncbi:MAG: cadherin-like domain-containing protein [Gemmatimonadales bacterium]